MQSWYDQGDLSPILRVLTQTVTSVEASTALGLPENKSTYGLAAFIHIHYHVQVTFLHLLQNTYTGAVFSRGEMQVLYSHNGYDGWMDEQIP
jgi:hypothetical protein